MNQITPIIKLHTYQESLETGLQLRSLVLQYQNNCYHLQGGTRDTIYVFTESIGIYVLTVNKALGYLSLHCFMSPEPDPINSLFLHNHQEITEHLGNKWEGIKAETIVKRLIYYLY